ncbi:VOC family protein [Labrys okinawensis]|uniref:VOC family protein n=1 Tax=Labrys okinawensis TaxID=346911 RepID=UPI0039BD20A5
MLGSKIAVATLPVRSLPAARLFYEEKVGLEIAFMHEPSAIAYKAGNSIVLVYESTYGGTNNATAVTWVVDDDMTVLVAELKQRGVAFQHYDLPGVTREGDIHHSGALQQAWFKDPDGNIHGLASG